MFDYALAHWLAFLTAAALLNLSPGPDMVFMLSQSARHGTRSGFTAMFGAWLGTFCHVILAAAGLSAVVLTSAAAFTAVKWAGAAYLIGLGLQAWRHGTGPTPPATDRPDRTRLSVFRRGILVALSNPKTAVFFLAFLPQFVVPGAGPVGAQLFLHGALIIVVAGAIEPPLVLLGGRLAARLRDNPRIGTWLERMLGSLFIALGLRLAFAQHA